MDITKCEGKNCLFKVTCWRFRAPADSIYQSYSNFDDDMKQSDCEGYLKLSKLQIEFLKKEKK
jgi:hypothetical protein